MIGDILKELRIKKGVTQDDIAKLLNVKRQTYSAYERNVSSPDITTVKILTEYYSTSLNYLLGIEESPQKKTHLSDEDRRVLELFQEHPEMYELVKAIRGMNAERQKDLLDFARLHAQKYGQIEPK